ncbi:hypothetical protein T07_12096 [Trichinella nelsoni]|uniref:Uncharacterized protein n=1 Tax=Trichinella nelsoni TaxID=6336 RepID=A0A0V0RD87_9BILA|nr:hypothetical protein T07_12096 [Trichinella nelsoni]
MKFYCEKVGGVRGEIGTRPSETFVKRFCDELVPFM